LFDGAAARGRSGSGTTADLAALLGWPVVLVLDVTGQTETAAAVALGCARYRDDVDIAGVILNRVASQRHLSLIAPAFERINLPVFGAMLREDGIALPERHLGLVQAREIATIEQRLDRLADLIDAAIDVDTIRQSARPAKLLPTAGNERSSESRHHLPPPGQRIALAQDLAFSFMYPHLLRQWRNAGAEIIPFSPLADEAPDPAADAVWLPGGYPNSMPAPWRPPMSSAPVFATWPNGPFRSTASAAAIWCWAGARRCRRAQARNDRAARTGDLLRKTKLHLGYRRARLQVACSLGAEGTEVFGHEFHYAGTVSTMGQSLVDCTDASGAEVPEQGVRQGSTTGTFFHLIDGAVA